MMRFDIRMIRAIADFSTSSILVLKTLAVIFVLTAPGILVARDARSPQRRNPTTPPNASSEESNVAPQSDWPENLPEHTRPPSIPVPPPIHPIVSNFSELQTGEQSFLVMDRTNRIVIGVAKVSWKKSEKGILEADFLESTLLYNQNRLFNTLQSGALDCSTHQMIHVTVEETRVLPAGHQRTERWDGPIINGWWKQHHLSIFTVLPTCQTAPAGMKSAASPEDVSMGELPPDPSTVPGEPQDAGSQLEDSEIPNPSIEDGAKVGKIRMETIRRESEIRWSQVKGRLSWPFWWVLQCNPKLATDGSVDGSLHLTQKRSGDLRAAIRMTRQPVTDLELIPSPASLELPSPASEEETAGVEISSDDIDKAVERRVDPEIEALKGNPPQPRPGWMSIRSYELTDALERSRIPFCDSLYRVDDRGAETLAAILRNDTMRMYIPCEESDFLKIQSAMQRALARQAVSKQPLK